MITWGFLGETVLQMGAAHPVGPFALERMWYVVPGQSEPARIACPGGLGQGRWFGLRSARREMRATWMAVDVLIDYRYEEPRSLGSRLWGIFVSVKELDKNAFIEGYEFSSQNRGLGPSGYLI